jgi:subtilisin family serine protease
MWRIDRSQLKGAVILAGLFASCASHAATTSLSIQPNSIFAYSPTQVTFVANIDPDPKLIKNGVRLLRSSANGTLGIVGAMHDDGTNGDAVANDNQYTLTATFNEPYPGTLPFVVSVAYTGVALREQSSPYNLTVSANTSLEVTPGQTEITIPQGQTASATFTLNVSNQNGSSAALTVTQGIDPVAGLDVSSNYPPGGWTTTNANDSFVVTNTFMGQQPGDYTFSLAGNLMIGGTPTEIATHVLVHVLAPPSGPGNLNLTSWPTALQENTSASVLFSAAFAEGATMPSSALLEEVDAGGNVLQSMGNLLDDGTGEDVEAGDGVYTGAYPVVVGGAGANRHFRATGQFASGSPIASSIYDLEVVPYAVGFQPGEGTVAAANVAGAEVFYCNQVLAIFKPGADAATVASAAASIGGAIIGSERALRLFQIGIPCNGAAGVQAAIATLLGNPNVQSAEPNVLVPMSALVPNDTYWGSQWGPAKIRAGEAWIASRGGTSIAVLDTGVNYNHPDLSGKVVLGYDFVNNDANPMDDNNHGTHVAGIAAGKGNNATGVAGVAWNSNILAVKVCNSSGSCPTTAIANGILYAIPRAKIISMSLGGPFVQAPIQLAVASAVLNGKLVVAAAGNTGNNQPQYPCSYPSVLCVGSTTNTDARSGFSTYGPQVDIAAPGSGILSSVISGYAYSDGTSMATPHISGVAALVWSRYPAWSAAQVQNRLIATGKPLPGLQIGRRVDAFDAVFNGSFEDGLNGWNWSGTASAATSLGSVMPTRDARMGMISSGPAGAVVQSQLYQNFSILPFAQSGYSLKSTTCGGGQTTSPNVPVRLSYSMLTEEYPEWIGTIYNDYMQVLLNGIQVAYESVNGSSFVPIYGINFPGGDNTTGWTRWKSKCKDVSVPAGGGNYLMRVSDQGDWIYDSVMLADDIRFK